jgi:hypothetical protein
MENLQKINQCLLEIRKIEDQKMIESAKENKLYSPAITSWCQTAEKCLNDFILETRLEDLMREI